MPWMVETYDKFDCAELRNRIRPAHLNYLEAHKGILLACGAKIDDEGKAASGGLYLLDLETREDAQSFIEQDPFYQEGLFARVFVTRWRKAYLNGFNTLNED
ncbi:YciI family protein [Celeribacter sp.]|uniref:YciI family protein n=1 Tax=Celeribacter sp. TaxID=1890673 RepID=UPI003A8FD2AD